MVEALRPEVKGPGDITDEAGKVLGQHDGIARYTVGQSKKLGNVHTKDGTRQMVTRIDAAHRRIIVGPRALVGRRSFRLRDVNWWSIRRRRGSPAQSSSAPGKKPVKPAFLRRRALQPASNCKRRPCPPGPGLRVLSSIPCFGGRLHSGIS